MMKIHDTYTPAQLPVLYPGDCRDLLRTMPDGSVDLTVTSPPYCMGKDYDTSTQLADFAELQRKVIEQVTRVTKKGGSICWQVGYYVKRTEVFPLDYIIYEIANSFSDLKLRDRIIWTFGHGPHCTQRFSGRHETILWFTKGDDYWFDLDAVRIPQKYPGKKFYKGPRRGAYSGNPLGKNPSNVWEIPHVKAAHVEKTIHPCQFPIALAIRLIQALSRGGAIVLDPFCGSGTTAVASILTGRLFIGAEKEARYVKIAKQRMLQADDGKLPYRPLDKPLRIPTPREAVSRTPGSFVTKGKQ